MSAAHSARSLAGMPLVGPSVRQPAAGSVSPYSRLGGGGRRATSARSVSGSEDGGGAVDERHARSPSSMGWRRG